MTHGIGEKVTGFHCHTSGKMTVPDQSKPTLIPHIRRASSENEPQDIVSGVANKDGNVVGVLMHALLDRNESVIQSIAKSLDISAEELREIRDANSRLTTEIKREVGIATNVKSQLRTGRPAKRPDVLLITATGSGSGKTFIVTGVAGALKKRGFRVGVIKVGGDIRDLVPALYLIKEPIRDYSSIRIGESGWRSIGEVMDEASQHHDFLLVEGAMNAFTGLFNENVTRPTSTAEVALAMDAPTIVVVGCDKEGIEGAVLRAPNHASLMKHLGIKAKGVVFNKARTSYMTDEIKLVITHAFKSIGVEMLGIVPRIELEGRGMIPEA